MTPSAIILAGGDAARVHATRSGLVGAMATS